MLHIVNNRFDAVSTHKSMQTCNFQLKCKLRGWKWGGEVNGWTKVAELLIRNTDYFWENNEFPLYWVVQIRKSAPS